VDVIDENCIEQQKWICAFDPLMKTLAIDEIDKGEEREGRNVGKSWERQEKFPRTMTKRKEGLMEQWN